MKHISEFKHGDFVEYDLIVDGPVMPSISYIIGDGNCISAIRLCLHTLYCDIVDISIINTRLRIILKVGTHSVYFDSKKDRNMITELLFKMDMTGWYISSYTGSRGKIEICFIKEN